MKKICVEYWTFAGFNTQTGEKQYVRATYTDRMVTPEEAGELTNIYNLPSAQGSLPMSGDDGTLSH